MALFQEEPGCPSPSQLPLVTPGRVGGNPGGGHRSGCPDAPPTFMPTARLPFTGPSLGDPPPGQAGLSSPKCQG